MVRCGRAGANEIFSAGTWERGTMVCGIRESSGYFLDIQHFLDIQVFLAAFQMLPTVEGNFLAFNQLDIE